jgi:hypothetical protein
MYDSGQVKITSAFYLFIYFVGICFIGINA